MQRSRICLGLLLVACGGGTTAGTQDASGPLPDASFVNDAATQTDASTGDSGDATDASDAPVPGYGPYGSPGSHTVTTSSLSVTTTQRTFNVTLYLPSGTGPFPIVLLSSGFFQPALAYDAYGQRLASWGIVAVLRDDPNLNEGSSNVADDIAYEVTMWLPSQNASGALAGKLDTSKIGLAGHSRGGQVSLLAAENGAKGHILGVFGLDPVDGTPAALPTVGSLGVPVAFLGETTDSAGTNACAPTAQNFAALYGGASSPTVAITITGADHTMFEDPAQCAFCGLCVAGTANGVSVRALSARYLMAFFARELQGDTSVGATFDGAGAKLDIASNAIELVSK